MHLLIQHNGRIMYDSMWDIRCHLSFLDPQLSPGSSMTFAGSSLGLPSFQAGSTHRQIDDVDAVCKGNKRRKSTVELAHMAMLCLASGSR